MQKTSLPIGVFDSGLGGLSAVREIKKILPDENIIYFGDTGRLPYGTRSAETIIKYACDDMNFLMTKSVKAVLVACGTVSSTALGTISKNFDIPVLSVVEPAAKAAIKVSSSGRIAYFATPSTVRTGAFEKIIGKFSPQAEVSGIGCPMFVPLVENGYISRDCEITRNVAREYLLKLKTFSPDAIILGCTHYPLIKDIIEDCAKEIIGDVAIIDSGKEAALSLKEFLLENNLQNTNYHVSKTEFFVSDEPYNFSEIASRFLGEQTGNVTKINIEDYLYQTI